jgi:hypothetical protein
VFELTLLLGSVAFAAAGLAAMPAFAPVYARRLYHAPASLPHHVFRVLEERGG